MQFVVSYSRCKILEKNIFYNKKFYAGKGENIWDHLTHNHSEFIKDRSTGDIACDSYNKYMEDVDLLANLGVDYYRFSLSWARILPNGINNINQKGIDYYNNLINALLEKGIKPMVTIYHWDLPQYLQNLGGWTNPAMIKYYTNFARIAFQNFGDRVPYWATFNEANVFCLLGYGGVTLAPVLNSSGIADYLCINHVLKAHAKVYHMYDEEFRPSQNGNLIY